MFAEQVLVCTSAAFQGLYMKMDWTKSWPSIGRTRQRRVLGLIRNEMVVPYLHSLEPLYPMTLPRRTSIPFLLT